MRSSGGRGSGRGGAPNAPDGRGGGSAGRGDPSEGCGGASDAGSGARTVSAASAPAGQPVHQPAEAVDRALQRRRHLERPLERRHHRDQLRAGLDHLARPVDDLATAIIDPPAGSRISSRARPAPRATIQPLAEGHERLRPLIEPLGDLEHLSSDRRDLLAELEDPIELCRRRAGYPRHRAEVGDDPVHHDVGGFDGEAEEAQCQSTLAQLYSLRPRPFRPAKLSVWLWQFRHRS